MVIQVEIGEVQGGVREERTDHTKLFPRTFAGFGLTWHQKVHFSTFDGKLESQCTRNGAQNPPFCQGSLQNTFIIFLEISPTYFSKKNHTTKIARIDNLKIWKSQKPGSLTGAQFTVRVYHLPFGVTIYRSELPSTFRSYRFPFGETPSKWERHNIRYPKTLGWGGVIFQESKPEYWALVSEPGFLDFQIFDSRDFLFLQNITGTLCW